MTTQRQIQEATARCVSLMVYYHNGEKTTKTRGLLTAEIRAVGESVRGLDFGDGEGILRLVESELRARYGSEGGGRINAEFVRAFDGFAVLAPAGTR
jgi:hypothetical protein